MKPPAHGPDTQLTRRDLNWWSRVQAVGPTIVIVWRHSALIPYRKIGPDLYSPIGRQRPLPKDATTSTCEWEAREWLSELERKEVELARVVQAAG